MSALGIDIGGTCIKLALLDPASASPPSIFTTAHYARPSEPQLRAVLQDALRREPFASANITAIGLCVPGIVDPATCAITVSNNIPGLIGVPLSNLIAAALGKPTPPPIITTDARAAATDFWHSALSRAPGRLLAISLGTGVGACVLDDGVPLKVTGETPGHFGSIDVTVDEPGRPAPIGPDGGAGSLESYLGLPALRARFGDSIESVLASLTIDSIPLRALARALRIAHAIYRPNHIALLGGIGRRLEPRCPALHATVSQNLTRLARPGWTLDSAHSDHHAALGAARLAESLPPR